MSNRGFSFTLKIACATAFVCSLSADAQTIGVANVDGQSSLLAVLAISIAGLTVLCAWLFRRSEDYRQMLSGIHPDLFVALASPDGRVLRQVSMAPRASGGASANAGPIWNPIEAICRTDEGRGYRRALAAAARGERVQFEAQSQARADQTGLHQIELAPIRGRRGSVRRIAISALDVTQRRQAEQRMSEELCISQFHFENSPLAIVELTPEYAVKRWSVRAQELYGYSAEEAIGHDGFEVMAFESDELTAGRDDLHRMISSRETLHKRYGTARRRDGSELWLETHFTILRDPAGKPLSIFTLAYDLTRQHRALAVARAAEVHFRGIFEQAAVGIALIGLDGRWLNVNNRTCAITGYTPNELLETDFQSITHADDIGADMGLLHRLIALEIDDYQIEKRCIRKDKSVVWVKIFMQRIDATGESPTYFVAAIEDINERKLAETRLAALTAGLEIEVQARTEQLSRTMLLWQRRNDELELITAMTGLLPAARDLEEAVRIVARYIPQLFPFASGALYFQKETADGLLVRAAQWGDQDGLIECFDAQDCWSIRLKHEHRITSLADPMRCSHIDSGIADQAYSCVPILAVGQEVGLLQLSWKVAEACHAPDAVMLKTIVDQLGLAIANVRLRDELRRQASHDPLTGLFNRRQLDEACEREWRRAKRNQKPLALLMMDVDHFKAFNDRYGHQAGDECLKYIAGAISGALRRPPDLVARYGGEEFVVLLPETDLDGAQLVADRILNSIRKLKIEHAGGFGGFVSISIGVAAAVPGAENSEKWLLQSADRALYTAKSAGRNNVQLVRSAPAKIVFEKLNC